MNVMKKLLKNINVEILGTIAIIALVILFSLFAEKPLTAENGIQSDAEVYYRVAQEINLHQGVIAMPPYVYRIGTPFLVSLFFPNNLFLGFKIINVIGAVVAIFLLLFWLRLYLKNSFVRMILIGLFATHWLGVLRISFFSPVHVESIALVFNLIGFILVFYLQRQPENLWLLWVFSVLTFIGVIFREMVIFLSLIYLIMHIHKMISSSAHGAIKAKIPWLYPAIPLISGMLAVALTRILVKPDSAYSLLAAMILWMYQKPFPSYVQSYFTTYGPLLAVFIPSAGAVKKYLISDKFNFYYLILICILAWGIGSDTDRFMYWAMPVWYVMFGVALEALWQIFHRRRALMVALLIVQCLAQRSFLPYPDYAPEKVLYRIPLLTVICNDGCGLDLPSYNGRIGSGLAAATCTPTPCLQKGNPYYLQLFLFLENVLAVGAFAYLLTRAQNGNFFLLLQDKIKLKENKP